MNISYFCNPKIVIWMMDNGIILYHSQVEVKRTVPRADMNDKLVSRTKKIFVGGIPPALTEGNMSEVNILLFFFY